MAEKDLLDVVKNERTAIDRFKNQSLLRKQFGDAGLKVYALLGEKRTVGEILTAAGITEEKLVEMLEFMDENRMITIGVVQPAEEEIMEKKIEEKEVEEEKEEVGEEERGEAEKLPRKRVEEAPRATPSMSPFEKIIYEKFGKTGLNVYNLIDGERTAEEILNETGINEVKLVEILEFMDKQGIIKLEKPKEELVEEKKPAFEAEEKALVELPEPLLEEHEAPPAKVEEKIDFNESVPIDVPIKQGIGVIQKITLEAELTRKFGGMARRIYNSIDNRKDTVSLVLETGLCFDDMDDVLAYLGQKGAALFATLSQEDIQERYGKDGLRIYDKYGREGVLLYELIGKANTLREMVAKSKLSPERAVAIFMHIHGVLGLEIALDKSALYRELGIFKK